jgi:flagellar assembly protein FliH
MSVYKDKMGTIEFKVSDYQFEAFDTAVGSVNGAKDFEFINFDKNSPLTKPEHQKVIKAERGSATKNQFEIAPMVKEHRGLVEQENREREDRIEEEVKKRVDALREQAYQQGYNEGEETGRKETIEHTKHEVEEKVSLLNDMIYRVLEAEQEMLDSYKIEIYTLTRSLTKWVILRELNDDKDYLKRLLEKLIHEINSKSNLLIKVGVSQFKNMPEVLEQVEASLGKIKNTRLELDDTLDSKGLVIESDNGIINASLKQQFKGISKLFESLGVSQETESEAEIEAESEDEGDSDL